MTKQKDKMKIVVLLGSARPHSHTAKATDLLVDELMKDAAVEVDVLDPRQEALALPGLENSKETSKRLQDRVRSAAGLILVTPEYDGSYSSAIKLLIEHLGYPSVIEDKPVALLGVASGRIGAVKALEHLRSVCGHIGALVLPWSKSVPSVHAHFDDAGHCTDEKTEETIRSVARSLLEFLHTARVNG